MKNLKFKNGDLMPAFGLGTWLSSREDVKQAIIYAVKNGYRHIDCAAIYGNEDIIGEALDELFKSGTVTREELWITSKLWNDNHAPQDVESALRQTLRDLHLDYLDLYLIHWPVSLVHGVQFPHSAADFVNPPIPAEITWQKMEEMQQKGLARHIGVSNFSVSKLSDLLSKATVKPELNQVEIHPYFAQQELVDYCTEQGVLMTAYSPLGCGFRSKTGSDPVLDNKTVTLIAAAHEATPAQVVLAWGMQRGYAVIPKSVHPERIRSNWEAVNLIMRDDEMAEIFALDREMRLTKGEPWTLEGAPDTQETLWN